MKAKRVLSLSLVVFVSLSLMSGCKKSESNTAATKTPEVSSNFNKTGLPLVKEKETMKFINIIGDADAASKDIKLLQEVEDKTNVHIEFEDITGTAWKEKKGIKMASGDLPDAIMGTFAFTDIDLINYGSQGLFKPLEKLSEEYAPNFMKALKDDPELKKNITTSDGHIYAVPSYDDGFVPTTREAFYINQVWLNKLNLKVPTTYDEFYEVLKAFKDKDPNGNGKKDEIPMTFSTQNNYASEWFASFGVLDYPDNHIAVKNGKVIYSAIQPEYKEAIKYFNKLFSEGLVDKETFTQDSKVFNAKLKAAPERIVGAFKAWRSTSWSIPGGPNEKDYIAIPPLKGPNGLQKWPQYITAKGLKNRGSFVIPSSSKKPELAMRWVDNFISEEYSIQTNLGYKIGTHLEKTSDGKYKILRAPDMNKPGENLLTTGSGEVYILKQEHVKKFLETPPHMVEKYDLDKIYEKYLVGANEYFPKVFFTAKESEQLAQYQADITPYVNGLYAKWMMDGGIDAEWDAYNKKLKDMKLDELLKVYQGALDRYNSIK